MIEVPRWLARSFRSVLRRCLMSQGTRATYQTLLVRSDGHMLTLQASTDEIGIRCQIPSECPPGQHRLCCLGPGPIRGADRCQGRAGIHRR